MSAHKKQFVIGNQPKIITEGWQTLSLGENVYLSYCPHLLISNVKDINGEAWVLLGLAIQTEKEKDDPLTEIGNSSTENVKELYKSWNGRWMLIGNNEIHMDCCGLLGCFYTTINKERWISSSLAILKEIGGFSARPEKLEHRSDFEWYPLPLTRFEEVRKLLPSQILNLKTLNPEQRTLPQPISELPYSEILEKLMEKMKISLLNLANLNRKIFLPLTAGYDSRLILAVAHHSGVKVETYTAGQPHISNADIELPYKLAKKTGYHHLFIKMNPSSFSKEKEELYDYHTGGNSNDIDRKRFAHGQWDVFDKGAIILRGGALEIGRCIYWNRIRSSFNLESIIEGSRPMYIPFKSRALSEWIKWVKQTPTEGLDWRDRYYWEQRVAGWLSSIEQSLDLTDTERFYIVNSHEIISLLLSIPVKKRRTSKHNIDLIKKMSPGLLQYSFTHVPIRSRLQKFTRMPLSDLYKKLRKKADIYFDKK